jgi:hypothetical protein
MVMVLIVILAFASYFFVINNNLYFSDLRNDDDEPFVYYESYYGSVGVALVSIYLMGALGDFDSGLYTEGSDKYAAFTMFLLATFIIAVVFMNMLIALLGETFGQVLETAVESGIREQVVLIADH